MQPDRPCRRIAIASHPCSLRVEDCPLVMTAKNAAATIASVTLQMELAKRVEHGEVFFRVRWIIQDKTGRSGEIFVVNSFSLNPGGRHAEIVSTRRELAVGLRRTARS